MGARRPGCRCCTWVLSFSLLIYTLPTQPGTRLFEDYSPLTAPRRVPQPSFERENESRRLTFLQTWHGAARELFRFAIFVNFQITIRNISLRALFEGH